MSSTRTRHMVEIADSSWEKLERLAYRLDAAQYVYKGRPRYGKLLELAIEKLEDSTMEWTEEEIPGEQGYDIIGALEDVLQDATIEMPPKGYTFGYNTPQGEPVYYKEKSKDIKFTLSAKPIDPDLLKETQETVGKAMAIHLEKAVKEAIVSGKPKQSDTPMLDAFKKNPLPNIFGLDDVASAANETAKSTAKLAQALKEHELVAHGFTQPDPATIHEADVWATQFTTKAGTFIALRARTDKLWTEEQTTLIQNAVYKVVAGSATFYSPFHLSYTSEIGFNEYAAVLDADPIIVEWTKEEAKKALKAILVEKGLSGTKQLPLPHDAEAKKPKQGKSKVYVHGLSNGVNDVVVEIELTQALSATRQMDLRFFALNVALHYVVNTLEFGDKSIDCILKNTPWNKLSVQIVFPFDVALKSDLKTVGSALQNEIEAWLLQGNFIGPLAKDLF